MLFLFTDSKNFFNELIQPVKPNCSVCINAGPKKMIFSQIAGEVIWLSDDTLFQNASLVVSVSCDR
jgi:hypothetical protein